MTRAFSPSKYASLNESGWTIAKIKPRDFLEEQRARGTVISDPISGCEIDNLHTSNVSLRKPRNLSVGYPSSELPLHTDYPNLGLPPRFVCLFAIAPDASNETTVFPIHQFIAAKEGRQFFKRQLQEPIKLRSLNGKSSVMRICEISGSGLLVRYSWNCMEPFFKKGRWVFDYLNELPEMFPTYLETFVLKEDEVLIIDNFRCLHGRRSSIAKPKTVSSRIVGRILLSSLPL